MTLRSAICLIMLTTLLQAGALQGAGEGRPRPVQSYADGYVVVKFNEREVKGRVPNFRSRGMPAVLDKLKLPPGVKVRETEFAKWNKRRNGASDVVLEDMSLFMYLDLPVGLTRQGAVERLSGNPMIEYIEMDPIGSAGATFPTNDPLYSSQWYLGTSSVGRIYAPEAWDISQGSTGVIIAVLDTGVDTNIINFQGRTVPGWDFVNNDSNPADDNNHGTEVASILCASANDAYRGVGIDWNCRLMPLKVLDNNGDGALSWWAQATDFAVTNGAKVINLSAGSLVGSLALSNSICNAVSNGVIYVTIAHNDGLPSVRFPGSMKETITVGGITSNGVRWSGSNYGEYMDLVAPSSNILGVIAGGAWHFDAVGTSYAAPMVSGAAGLLLAVDPTLNNSKVRDLLCGGADDRVSADTNDLAGYDLHYGWGKLNIYNSLRLLTTEIDTITAGSVNTYLSWSCTRSAQTNKPYGVQWSASIKEPLWISVSNVAYTINRAHWTGGNGGASNRFYRSFIKNYQSWTNG